jgi:hypothetical protein
MFGQDRSQLRRLFFAAWHKYLAQQSLDPLEQLIVSVVQQHPEYHSLLADEAANLDKDYTPEMGQTNPFLHMAMHIAVQEQLATQRPDGITACHQELLLINQDAHVVEHQMMECLAEMMWQSQREGALPDEAVYLQCLRQLTKRS